MKSMTKTFYLFLTCLFVLSSCDKQKPVKTDTYSVSKNCYPNSERPSNAITYEEMAAMFYQYDNNQGKILNAFIKENIDQEKVETTSSWYAINDLKQYIAYVERLSQEKDIPLTGIRIYAAAYPEDYQKESYRGKQTLIFAPTTKIGNKEDVSYEPLQSSNEAPVSMMEYLTKFTKEKNINRASFLPNLMFDNKSSAANRLGISPPLNNE